MAIQLYASRFQPFIARLCCYQLINQKHYASHLSASLPRQRARHQPRWQLWQNDKRRLNVHMILIE